MNEAFTTINQHEGLGVKEQCFRPRCHLSSFKIKSGGPQSSSLGPLLVSTSAQLFVDDVSIVKPKLTVSVDDK